MATSVVQELLRDLQLNPEFQNDEALQRIAQSLQAELHAWNQRPQPKTSASRTLSPEQEDTWATFQVFHQLLCSYNGWLNRDQWLHTLDIAADLLTRTPPAAQSSPQWNWSQQYKDPVGYSRVVAAGSGGNIKIASGAWPPGYSVSDGVTVGGIIPTGTNNGTLPVRLQPASSGIGSLKFVTHARCTIVNNAASTGSFSFSLGVDSPSEFNMPMYPYLGVAHDAEVGQMTPVTIQAGQARRIIATRLDVLDNLLLSNRPVATWPSWTVNYDPTNLLYPAVSPVFDNFGTVALTIADVASFGFSC